MKIDNELPCAKCWLTFPELMALALLGNKNICDHDWGGRLWVESNVGEVKRGE